MTLCKYAMGIPTKLDKLSHAECREALKALTSDLVMSSDPGVQSDISERINRVQHRLLRLNLGMI